eukprot:scaffold13637_cov112-Isochrysis_galbana.AAC.5
MGQSGHRAVRIVGYYCLYARLARHELLSRWVREHDGSGCCMHQASRSESAPPPGPDLWAAMAAVTMCERERR